MLMILMMMKKEQLPTFFSQRQRWPYQVISNNNCVWLCETAEYVHNDVDVDDVDDDEEGAGAYFFWVRHN